MAYAKEHIRLTFGGVSASSEIWQCGLNWAPDGSEKIQWPAGGWDMPTLYEALGTAFHDSFISNGAQFQWVKVALIGTDGLYSHEPQDHYGTAVYGYVATLASSPQDSVCVTLWSGSTLGKSNYGRFYLPWSGVNVDRTTGKIPNTLTPQILAAWVTGLRKVSDSLNLSQGVGGPDVFLQIMGPTGRVKRVKTIRIGDVVDTQRRRRNGLREVYIDAAMPISS